MGRKILDLDFKCSKCWTPDYTCLVYLGDIHAEEKKITILPNDSIFWRYPVGMRLFRGVMCPLFFASVSLIHFSISIFVQSDNLWIFISIKQYKLLPKN